MGEFSYTPRPVSSLLLTRVTVGKSQLGVICLGEDGAPAAPKASKASPAQTHRRHTEGALTSLAHDPAMRKFPGKVGGLKDRQPMLSSGEDVTSISWGKGRR